MSALQAMLDPSRRRTDGVAPLLTIFTVPMLLVVGIVVLVSAEASWGLMAIAILAVVALLGVVMFGVSHLLLDDGD